jgi:alpha-L-fucosidase
MFRKALLLAAGISLIINVLNAQTFVHEPSERYVAPKEPSVKQQLDQWQDLKFGMLIHWGLYSQLGIVESWSICAEEADWIPRDSTIAYDTYKRKYWSTIDTFKPDRFDPAAWAKAGKQAGMNYMVFTTKHHDGFNLFDTRQTDFSITHGAFKDDPRSNAAKEVFNAFRNENYWIGAYFSKPDWHSPYYWWDRYATPNRSNNYRIDQNPWRWNQFKTFVYNQIEELVNGDYGKIDILWLDGGWVCAPKQDIDMPKIAAMVRKYQPSMLIVDRTVAGEFENYQTPERGIPATQLNVPWESCIPLGNDWGFVPNDAYKSSAKVIHTLIEATAKGGNLLLGIGPKADGTLPTAVVSILENIGVWLHKNGEAIFNTRITPVYNDGNTWFTQSKDGKTIYALVGLEEGEPLPHTIRWQGNEPRPKSKIICLQTGKAVQWKKTAGGIEIRVPVSAFPTDSPAYAFKIVD